MKAIKKILTFTLAVCLSASMMLTPSFAKTKSSPPKIKSISVKNKTLIQGKNKTTINFTLTKKATKTKIYILDSTNKKIRTFSFKNKPKGSVVWNGKNAKGYYVSAGKYKAQIVVGKYKKTSSTFIIKSSSVFSGGSGTKNSPYKVSTVTQLKNIYRYNGCYFRQTKDIDLNYNSVMLFNSTNKFDGTYDGAGYSIKNYLFSNSQKDSGTALFYSIGKKGVVKNLTLDNFVLTCGNCGAGIVVENYGTVKDCKVSGTITTLTLTKSFTHNSGMICAENFGGKIINCSSTGSISSKYGNCENSACAGGIVGYNEGLIMNASTYTDVYSSADWNDCYSGGIAGINLGTISDCEANCKEYICADAGYYSNYAGGIVAKNSGSIIGSLFIGDTDKISAYNCGEIQGN